MTDKTLALSACVISMNEEDNIEQCLASLAFCDEIILVDSHSSDRTRELASDLGARVIERDWPGFGEQKEFAVSEARHAWVLCLDADEWVSDELRDEIRALCTASMGGRKGWRMPRLSNYLGTWIHHGGWYPNYQLRLYDRRHARWGGRAPHEKVELEGATGTLKGHLCHRPYRSVGDHLRKIDTYTTTMARTRFAAGKRVHPADLVLRPAFRFFRFYILKRAFLHGWVGLFLSFLDAHYSRMKYAKTLCLQRGLPLEDGESGGGALDS